MYVFFYAMGIEIVFKVLSCFERWKGDLDWGFCERVVE